MEHRRGVVSPERLDLVLHDPEVGLSGTSVVVEVAPETSEGVGSASRRERRERRE